MSIHPWCAFSCLLHVHSYSFVRVRSQLVTLLPNLPVPPSKTSLSTWPPVAPLRPVAPLPPRCCEVDGATGPCARIEALAPGVRRHPPHGSKPVQIMRMSMRQGRGGVFPTLHLDILPLLFDLCCYPNCIKQRSPPSEAANEGMHDHEFNPAGSRSHPNLYY